MIHVHRLLLAVSICGATVASAHAQRQEIDPAVAALKKVATNVLLNLEEEVFLVRFSKSRVTDEDLALLAPFTHLEYLAVVNPNITDEGLSHIVGLTNLDTLVISEAKLTDVGMASLAGLTKLEHLYLEEAQITDGGLKHLAGLEELQTLSLKNSRISNDGLKLLRHMTKLKSLFLTDTNVSDEGLQHLTQLADLETLDLCRTQVTGKGFKHLASLKQLKTLNLSATPVSAKHLSSLTTYPGLETVLLYNTSASQETMADLRKQSSKTTFYGSPPGDGKDPFRRFLADSTKPSGGPGTPDENSTATVEHVSGVRVARSDISPSPSAASNDNVPDFQKHIVPLLGRLGCNGRACHGSFQGKGGFRLSMFGYDFEADHRSLLEEDTYRVDVEHSDESLLLLKPTMQEEHGGGLRFEQDSDEYRLLHSWIKSGAPGPKEEPAKLVRLDVMPAEIVWRHPHETIQLQVKAIWSDGTTEDVTALTRFQTNDESVAEVTPGGVIRSTGTGDTYIISFYDKAVVSTQVIRPVTDRVGERYPQVPTPTKIDELVVGKLKDLGIVPSELCTDEEFIRRVGLDLIGTLPTPTEVHEFVADQSPDKRARKIDELLDHPAYVEWWSNFLGDLTGANRGFLGTTEMMLYSGTQWRSWLTQRVRDNTGWDRIAAGIILADNRPPGQTYEEFIEEQSQFSRKQRPEDFTAPDNSMPFYWFRSNLQTPEDRTQSFGYVFLGVRLECAQCHKHPFDQWSKRDFEQFKEFFSRIRIGVAGDAESSFADLRTRLGVPEKLNRAATRRQSYQRIAAEGRPIPWREVYIAPAESDGLFAKVLGGEAVDISDIEDPRVPLFRWLVDRDNPYFARAFVNRIWARYFNVGIVDPPDDFNLANPPSNKQLLDWLATSFVDHNFDMKWLHRTITNSRTYQLSWRTNETNRTDERNFSRSVIRRLPAETVIDAIVQATADDESIRSYSRNMDVRKIAVHPTAPQARRMDYSLLVFGKPIRTTNCDCERQMQPTLLQSLYVRNDEELIGWLNRSDGWLAQISRESGHSLSPEAEAASKATSDESGSPDKRSVHDVIESAYLRSLSRLPDADERELARKHLADSSNMAEGLRDLLWALLNTQEFLTNH